jgi:hypothetical protein
MNQMMWCISKNGNLQLPRKARLGGYSPMLVTVAQYNVGR